MTPENGNGGVNQWGCIGKVGLRKVYDCGHSQELGRAIDIRNGWYVCQQQDSCVWKGMSCMLHADLESSRQVGSAGWQLAESHSG